MLPRTNIRYLHYNYVSIARYTLRVPRLVTGRGRAPGLFVPDGWGFVARIATHPNLLCTERFYSTLWHRGTLVVLRRR